MSNAAKLKKRAAELEQKRQYDKALATYIEILEQGEAAGEESDVALYNRVGDLMFRVGNVADALTYYEKAADLYAERGFLNNAIALCNKILRQSPGRTSIYYKLGRISATKGFKSDAKKNFLEYADRMRAAGRPDEAFRALREFADLCPDQDDVRLMLAEQLSKENRTGEALEQLQTLHAKLEAEGRTIEARATIDRMRAIDPNISPRSSGETPAACASDLVFIDLSDDLPSAVPMSAAALATSSESLQAVEPLELDPIAPGAESATALASPDGDLPYLAGFTPTDLAAIGSSAASADAIAALALDAMPASAATFEGLETGAQFADSVDLVDAVAVDAPVGLESAMLADATDEASSPVFGDVGLELSSSADAVAASDATDSDRTNAAPTLDLLSGADEEPVAGDVPLDASPSLELVDMPSLESPSEDIWLESDEIIVSAQDTFDSLLDLEDAAGARELSAPLASDDMLDLSDAQPSSGFDASASSVDADESASTLDAIGTASDDAWTSAAITDLPLLSDDSSALDTGASDRESVADSSSSELVLSWPSDDVDEFAGDLAGDAPDSTVADTASLAIDALASSDWTDVGDIESSDPATAVGAEPMSEAWGETLLAETPVEETPVDETPLDETPLDETPVASDATSVASEVDDAFAVLETSESRDATETTGEQRVADGDSPLTTPDERESINESDLAPASSADLHEGRSVDGAVAAEHEPAAESFATVADASPVSPSDEQSEASEESAPPATVESSPEVGAPCAIELLAQGVHRAPNDWALRRRYAESLFEIGERNAGMLQLEVALLGLEHDGRLDDASAVADELVHLAPDLVRHHQKRVELAARAHDRARLVTAYVELAEALFRSGDAKKASAVFRRVVELAPDDARARAGLQLSSTPLTGEQAAASEEAKPTDADAASAVARLDAQHAMSVELAPPSPDDAKELTAPAEPVSAYAPVSRRTPIATARHVSIPTPIAPRPVPAPAAAAMAAETNAEPIRQTVPAVVEGNGFVDLGGWLRSQQPAKSTRMYTDAPQPTGDEDADFAEMLRRFKQGVANNVEEEDSESHYDLGVAYKEMGLVDEAIAEFQKALRGAASRVRTYEALGQCFIEKRQFEVACTVLARAVESAPGDDHQLVGVLYLSGYAAESLQRWREALGFYQRVFAVDIRFRDVAARLTQMERLASEPEYRRHTT